MKFLVFIFSVLLALQSFAADCTITGGIDVPINGYKPRHHVYLKPIQSETYDSISQQECFQKAILVCNSLPSRAEISITNYYHKMYEGSLTVSGAVYCSWEFDDGYIVDSSGYVTKYTNPRDFKLGDARVLGDDQALSVENN